MKEASRKPKQLPTQVQNIAITSGGTFHMVVARNYLWISNRRDIIDGRCCGCLMQLHIPRILYKRQVHLWYSYEEDGDTEEEIPNWMQCVCGRTRSRCWHL